MRCLLPKNNATWTTDILPDYNGKITWVPYDVEAEELEHIHNWKAATCTAPKICISCGETEGDPLGHNYITEDEAVYICGVCGESLPKGVESIVTELKANAENGEVPEEAIKEAVAKIQCINPEYLKNAMKTDTENANIVEQIAQLESFIHIAVNVSVDEETAEIIDQQEVTIVGAKLNAAENQKENITLVIGKPEGDATLHIPDGYELNNMLQFSMILQNVANTDALRVPVKISLPVPENMNPEQVVILHYNGDGTVREVIEPDVCKNGERYSANFVLASFCNFAMIERHKHVYESVVTDPNCMGNGYTTHTCSCGDSYVDSYVDALGHKYSAVVTPPTATEK